MNSVLLSFLRYLLLAVYRLVFKMLVMIAATATDHNRMLVVSQVKERCDKSIFVQKGHIIPVIDFGSFTNVTVHKNLMSSYNKKMFLKKISNKLSKLRNCFACLYLHYVISSVNNILFCSYVLALINNIRVLLQ